jgi:hypothetical protein
MEDPLSVLPSRRPHGDTVMNADLVSGSKQPQPRLYAIAHGKDYKDPNTKTARGTAAQIVKKLRSFHVIELTGAEYAALAPSEKAAQKKASGYIIGGDFGGLKKAENCKSRSLLTLDLDALTPETARECIERLRATGAHSLVYSTASHTPAKPRLRAIVFLATDVAPDDYKGIVQHYAKLLPEGAVSSESFKVGQIMYLPQRCSDGEEVFHELPGAPLDPAPIIEAARLVPRIEREKKVTPAWEKPGIVGAVGRLFGGDFDKAIAGLELPYKRSSAGATCGAGEDRYSFTGGSGADGAVWYPADGHLFSHHGTDPCREQSVTIFDVVRLQRHNPSQDDSAAPISERASHKSCERYFLEKYPALAGELYRPASTDELDDLGPASVDAELETPAKNPASGAEGPVIEILSLSADIVTRAFPPRRYSWGKYLPLRATSALIAEGKVGKSTLSLMRQLHGAAGKPFLGQPTMAGLYVYISCEDDFEEVERRAQKVLLTFTPAEQQRAQANFILLNGVGKGLQFVISAKGVAEISPTVDRIIAAVRTAADGRKVIDVAVDTVSRINGGAENDNSVMAMVEAAGARIAQALDAAVSLLHHTGKSAAREGIADAHTGRGASSFGDNCRSILRLMPVTLEMLKGLEGIDRDAVVRGDILKLVHAALNSDRKLEPIWLRRTDNGLLEQITPKLTGGADKAETMRAQFEAWWHKGGRKPFTRSAVTRSRSQLKEIWSSGVTEVDAREFYDAHTSDGTFEPAGEVKGAQAFTISREVAEAVLQDAAQWGLQATESGSALQ